MASRQELISTSERRRRRSVAGVLAAAILTLWAPAPGARALAADVRADGVILDARDALRRKDRSRLAAARSTALAAAHPVAPWVDYWDASSRIGELQQADLDAFYARWPGSYVEDRLRNDWLLELGKRRDWRALAAEFPHFRMNDDREVSCFALWADHLSGKAVARDTARAAWLAQRDADDGCAQMSATLFDARVLMPADVWRKARVAMDANRPRAARQAAALVSPQANAALAEVIDAPARYLARRATASEREGAELTTLALLRLASSGGEAEAASALAERWEQALPPDLSAWVWGALARQAAIKLSPDAADLYQRAERAQSKAGARDATDAEWPDETLAWKARAALRASAGAVRWQQVVQAINAMSAVEQRDATWIYWKARGLQALAKNSQDTEGLRSQAREMFSSIAGLYTFYGQLAAAALNQPLALPPRPQAPTPPEREAALQHPGLNRSLYLIALGLRSEGVREWNFSLRGMGERELLATAQLGCERELWDRCINTSDRTRGEVDMAQRFPTPYRADVLARSREAGLDPAYVYGLIRQESRFIIDARSGVGAAGLMQVMPATARWTANKIGLPYSAELIADRDTNLRLGIAYLRLLVDEFGSQAMAAAAYNAGPGRPRRWREGPVMEAAAWAENIPFNETRDYVKKVLANATCYAALLTGEPPALKPRLGRTVGPREPGGTAVDRELP